MFSKAFLIQAKCFFFLRVCHCYLKDYVVGTIKNAQKRKNILLGIVVIALDLNTGGDVVV